MDIDKDRRMACYVVADAGGGAAVRIKASSHLLAATHLTTCHLMCRVSQTTAMFDADHMPANYHDNIYICRCHRSVVSYSI